MSPAEDQISDLLAEAQSREDTHDWMGAFDLRAEAVQRSLDRTPSVPSARSVNPDNALEVLAQKFEPSKRAHDYIEPYWRELRDLRHSATKVLEIGVQTDRSVRMWKAFFPNAQIYGIDIDPRCAEFAEERIEVFIGDQTDETFLMDVITATGGGFDVVIDDGLHSAYSILKSFGYLYPALHDRGIYVIEDIMKLPPVLQFLNQALMGINHFPDDMPATDWPTLSKLEDALPWMTHHTVGLSVYRYLAFIKRGFNPGDNPYLSDPSVFQENREQARKRIDDHLTELERRGKTTTWDALVDHFGVNQKHHIVAVLRERGLAPHGDISE